MESRDAAVSSNRLVRAVERLDALIDWERRQRAAMRVSTDPERALLAVMGDPHLAARVVHVTGSKGKGSTASLVAAGLRAAGLRVGRYASPHVERINERVVIDGSEVNDELLAVALERALTAFERVIAANPEVEPTWFDLVTAAALWCFRRADVDWIVAEVGLGGRLDSTNVLHGEVCVITNVELEHTQVLGGTRALIAREKAGILKPGSTLVTALAEDDEAGAVVAARAGELGCPVVRPGWSGGTPPASIARANRDLAELALDELGRRGVVGADRAPVDGRRLNDRIAALAALPGRRERFVVAGRTVVVDGAHTPGSVAALVRELAADPTLPGRPVVVLGLARDKDLPAILKTVAASAERVVCTSVGSPLHRTAEELGAAADAIGARNENLVPPRAAVDRAVELATSGWVLVVGSLHLAGAVRPHLSSPAPQA